jgi:hypothetical protein
MMDGLNRPRGISAERWERHLQDLKHDTSYKEQWDTFKNRVSIDDTLDKFIMEKLLKHPPFYTAPIPKAEEIQGKINKLYTEAVEHERMLSILREKGISHGNAQPPAS